MIWDFFFLNNKLWSICRLWVTVAGTLLRHRSWSLHQIIVEQSCVLFPPCIWTGAHRPMAAHASCDIISKLASLPSYGLTHVILWTNPWQLPFVNTSYVHFLFTLYDSVRFFIFWFDWNSCAIFFLAVVTLIIERPTGDGHSVTVHSVSHLCSS